VLQLLTSGGSDSATQGQLAALTPEGFFQAWYDVKWWPDSEETAVRVARAWVQASDSADGRGPLATSLAFRGHVREAHAIVGQRFYLVDAQLGKLGVVPRDSTTAMFSDWLRGGDGYGIHAGLPWWAEHGDTVSLQRAVARWDSLEQATEPPRATIAGHLSRAAAAYITLARGDTVGAIGQFAQLRNLPNCLICYQEQLTHARLLVATGRDREAARLYDHLPFVRAQVPVIEAVVAALEGGLLHERLGDRAQAITALTFVVDAWRNADPELQPVVDEARAALARLAAEPRSKTGGP
jgi:hypothetical protein